MVAQESREASAIGACTFEAGTSQGAQTLSPAQQVGIPGGGHRNRARPSDTPELIDHDADVNVQMGINAENDARHTLCNLVHVTALWLWERASSSRAEEQDTHGAEQGSYQVTRSRPGTPRLSVGLGPQVNAKATRQSQHGPSRARPSANREALLASPFTRR